MSAQYICYSVLALVATTSPLWAGKIEQAEMALLYQRDNGGWPKNYDLSKKLSSEKRQRIRKQKSQVNDATIDNGATHSEIRLLAVAHSKTNDARFTQAALRGIKYLLDMQYENGGWPQFYPKNTGYHAHITFNDNAMIGVMRLMKDIANEHSDFGFVPTEIRAKCAEATKRGLDCILKCQVRVEGELTVWCAQHDRKTLRPQSARSYELASLSGSESVGIVRYLMQLDKPTPEVIHSVNSAIAWFESSQLKNIRLEKFRLDDGRSDRRVVQDANARPLWARFYNIETNEPIFCSRDGIPRTTLAEISHERRNGYSWLGGYANRLLDKEYPAWKTGSRKR